MSEKLFPGTKKERKSHGAIDRASGLSPKYPQDGYYMKGYNQKETDKKVAEVNSPLSPATAEAQVINLAEGE
ncbi:MAG: hypothetical protein LBR70_04020 [Lactobacillaceae bacterium]|jgi:hypothetical protein|nr:hypothetical protein [Lactobacillaceae bacterium]